MTPTALTKQLILTALGQALSQHKQEKLHKEFERRGEKQILF